MILKHWFHMNSMPCLGIGTMLHITIKSGDTVQNMIVRLFVKTILKQSLMIISLLVFRLSWLLKCEAESESRTTSIEHVCSFVKTMSRTSFHKKLVLSVAFQNIGLLALSIHDVHSATVLIFIPGK